MHFLVILRICPVGGVWKIKSLSQSGYEPGIFFSLLTPMVMVKVSYVEG